MRLPLATDLKTRVGDTTKDARLKNSYVEARGDQAIVRKRPCAQGGVPVGTGTAQGGMDGIVVFGDVLTSIPDGTTCSNATNYSIGDHVTVDYGDYWALQDNINHCPADSNSPSDFWSNSFVPAVPDSTVYATWNPEDKNIDISLSGNNLIASSAITTGIARSTISKSSGKWYWELSVTSFNPGLDSVSVGIANSNAGLNIGLGSSANGWAYSNSDSFDPAGMKAHNGIGESYGLIFTQGDVIGIALDMDLGTLQFYLNGASLGVAYSGLSGSIYAAVGFATIQASVITTNFGLSAFSYSVPSGYNSGLYT